ncbi:MAG: hypothetical protein LVS60_17345 [Nodosilinea sp. LVE1205-7]
MGAIPLAWYNLRHQRSRLLVAVAGVSFAVLLIFMNLGFLGALVNTTTNFYSQFNGDIFLISPQSLEISTTKAFTRERLYQAAGIEGWNGPCPFTPATPSGKIPKPKAVGPCLPMLLIQGTRCFSCPS